jgi:predicted deacetylase
MIASPKFILRFDDITPEMAWSKFQPFDDVSKELDLPLLVGVVPRCLDASLCVEQPNETFWDTVRGWHARGWSIAQHGYTHQYVTQEPGLLRIGKKSELAGLSYEEQLTKLDAGKRIMMEQGVWQPVFMAPSHSFDENTLRALSALGFRYITDGHGVYPYRFGGLTAVPQLFATPLHFGFGVYSICLHVNTLSDAEIAKTIDFVRRNRSRFVSFEDAAKASNPLPGVASMMRFLTSSPLRVARLLRG